MNDTPATVLRPGPLNLITDVPGIEVGNHQANHTGTTVILARAGAVGGVDVRGSAPGTRETDLLNPVNLVDRVNAIVLSGGSAFGLAAADGVVAWLEEQGLGWPLGPPGQVVPIVPGAVLFDLDRFGRDFQDRPTAAFGRRACEALTSGGFALGNVGAGAENHLNGVNTIQGGALFTLADFAFAAASNSHGRIAVASNASISFFKGVAEGKLIAKAYEISSGKTLATYLVEIRTEDGTKVALFNGTAFMKGEY